jgi:acyl-ACP thioesterase
MRDSMGQLDDQDKIRMEREIAFHDIDKYQVMALRGKITGEQEVELDAYIAAWLDAPNTMIVPSKPQWMN